MTQTARTVLPTDLVALVSHDGNVYANEAMTRDRIGTDDSPSPLETAFEQWLSFATGRHTCVSVKGATLRGLISARKRANKQAWEIDCLINAAGDDNGVLLSLLDRITDGAGKSGAMRIFLRLPPGETEVATSRAGFVPYVRERIWARESPEAAEPGVVTGLRRKTKQDPFAMFQLYTHVTPPEVRRIEGMTFGEWAAAQETLGRATQFVLDGDQGLQGWLRVAGDGDIGRFDLAGRRGALDTLVEAAVAKVADRAHAVTIVPEYMVELETALRRAGFEPREEYVVQARRTVRTVKEAQKAPALAHTTLI